MRFVLRNTNVYSDWESFSQNLVENGELFVQRAKESRLKLAEYGVPFIKDDDVILVHSYSRVVYSLLLKAKQEKLIRFKVWLPRVDQQEMDTTWLIERGRHTG